MHYSLLSRFQGGLLGAALGAELGRYSEQIPGDGSASAIQEVRQNLHHWRPGTGLNAPQSPGAIAAKAGVIAIALAETLIQGGDWQQPDSPLTGLLTSFPLNRFGATLGGAVGAIATLPLALFFHDNEAKLSHVLHPLTKQGQNGVAFGMGSLVISYAIARSLQNRWQTHQVLPQLIRYLQHQPTYRNGVVENAALTDLVMQLEQVDSLVQKRSSLQTALTTLQLSPQTVSGHGAIALALYCYLSTPTDFQLALGRAAHAGYCPSLVCTLTGALCGVNNGITGLPVAWRLAALAPARQTVWERSAEEIMELSTRLLATWAGVYNATVFPASIPMVAAPRVIRPPASP